MKKKILFIFSRHSKNPNDSTLTKDLSDKFMEEGHEVFITTMNEKKNRENTQVEVENNCKVLRVKTGNYFDSVGKIEKGITALSMPYQFEKAIKKQWGKKNFDFIFTHTPFTSSSYLLKKLKKHYKCPIILDLWDIFPQNAKDLEMITNKCLLNFLKKKEEKTYDIVDYVGCMSRGNESYIVKKNLKLSEKTFLLKNWSKLKPLVKVDKDKIRSKYNLLQDETIFVFGGNMGKPQKLENILNLAKETKELNVRYLFVGKGTEQNKLKKIAKDQNLDNVTFIDFVPREDYEKLISACDVGIVSLDERFTIPNFPSKTTDYFKLGLPILASLDECSYNDYGQMIIKEAKAGKIAKAGNIKELKKQVIKFIENQGERIELGKNGRKYYEKELDVKIAYKAIINKIEGGKNV